MTYNYSATLHTCWGEFIRTIIEKMPHLKNKQLQGLRKDFQNFYNFLSEFFNKQGLFKDSFDALAQAQLGRYEFEKTITFQSADKATIHLHYHENVIKR
jgi:hypothetical protein